jgi:hypothetical protein
MGVDTHVLLRDHFPYQERTLDREKNYQKELCHHPKRSIEPHPGQSPPSPHNGYLGATAVMRPQWDHCFYLCSSLVTIPFLHI